MTNITSEIDALKAENELLKFKTESAERIAAHEKLIREVEGYKRILRSTLMFLGIGSLGGILTLRPILNNYVDGQISAQVKKWNELEACIADAREARWQPALKKLRSVYQNEAASQNKSDADFRTLLFNTLVYVLASTNERISDGQRWQGEDEWKELCQDKEFLNRAEVQIDEPYCNQMFFCTLKFYKERDVLECIRSYIHAALRIIAEDRSKAPHYFDLAMTDLIAGNPTSALRNLREASDKDPSTYQDLVTYLTTFKNSVQFMMWSICAERSGVNFDSAVVKLTEQIPSTGTRQ
jgi:hypothetical protein